MMHGWEWYRGVRNGVRFSLDLPLRTAEIAVVANHPSFLNLVDLGNAHNSRPRSCLDFFISHSKRTTHNKKFFSETFTKKKHTPNRHNSRHVFPIDPHDIPWKSAFFLGQNLNFSHRNFSTLVAKKYRIPTCHMSHMSQVDSWVIYIYMG